MRVRAVVVLAGVRRAVDGVGAAVGALVAIGTVTHVRSDGDGGVEARLIECRSNQVSQ